MIRTTLIRTRSLGDVVLAAAFTRAAGPTCFVTHRRYHGLVARFPGVVEVRAPDAPLPAAARTVDLQVNLRTLRLHVDARVARQDLRRSLRAWHLGAPADPVLQRWARAIGMPPDPLPWLAPARRGEALVLVPGASVATKRWPHAAALAAAWDGPVRVLGGPGEESLVRAVAGAARHGEAVCEEGFDRTFDALEGAAVMVAGDTGLLHLGAAVGLPVVGLFGPTHHDDGYVSYADGVRQRMLGVSLDCRPCSRHGAASCGRGDHACLATLPVETVLAAARAVAALP